MTVGLWGKISRIRGISTDAVVFETEVKACLVLTHWTLVEDRQMTMEWGEMC